MAKTKEATRNSNVRSIGNMMEVLLHMAQKQEPARVTDLADELGLHKSVVSRYLSTLQQQGFAEKTTGGGYLLGIRLISVGEAARQQHQPVVVAKAFIESLRDKTDMAAIFTIPANDAGATVILSLPAPRTFYHVPLGYHLVPPNSPSACVTLAYLDEVERVVAIEKFGERWGVDSANKRQKLAAKLRKIRRDKYDFASNPQGMGLAGVAAPVFDVENELVGTIACVGPSRLVGKPPKKKVLAATLECAASVSAELGSTEWS
jgi:IclR family KDG regulon transcriptional repressor